ncbi:MAG: GNAT family N-acetyltransferase [Acidobacteria bacterium]|nr:GNAT family N-acetyltransferase [Acidobacteriota bacterium]
MLRKACSKDLDQLIHIIQQHKAVFPFLPRAVFKDFVQKEEVIVYQKASRVLGFVRYHHRKDGITTLHEIAVLKSHPSTGIGRSLIEALRNECVTLGQKTIRLKCPLDLPANGFYSHLGFQRVSIEDGRKRPLAVWENLIVPCKSPRCRAPSFFITLTHEASETRAILRLWDETADKRNPFARVVFTPLFSKPAAFSTIRQLKDERGSKVMFDSGGYQVQMGKSSYEELFDRLLRFYCENAWADWYVLPDHVPRSTDNDREVEFKVRESLDFARLFVRMMPDDFAAKAVGVVHGRTDEQIRRCVEAYADMGVRYLGFGSFGTSGPNGTVNLISQKSLRLLHLLQALSEEKGLRVHIFGIGSPSHLIRLTDADITPTSFDSAGWWKAGGFGDVFFSDGRRLSVSRIPSKDGTVKGIEQQRRRTNHTCQFCEQPHRLKHNRMLRVMHNVAVLLETVERLRWEENE